MARMNRNVLATGVTSPPNKFEQGFLMFGHRPHIVIAD